MHYVCIWKSKTWVWVYETPGECSYTKVCKEEGLGVASYKGVNLMSGMTLLGKVPNLTVVLKKFLSCNEWATVEPFCPHTLLLQLWPTSFNLKYIHLLRSSIQFKNKQQWKIKHYGFQTYAVTIFKLTIFLEQVLNTFGKSIFLFWGRNTVPMQTLASACSRNGS